MTSEELGIRKMLGTPVAKAVNLAAVSNGSEGVGRPKQKHPLINFCQKLPSRVLLVPEDSMFISLVVG